MSAQTNTAQVLPFGKEEPKKPSFGAMLKKADKTPETGKKKSTVVTIGDAPEEIKAAVDELMEAITAKKQAEGIIEIHHPVVAEFVRGRQDLDGFAGNFHSTYSVTGNRASAKVGYVNKYSLSAEDDAQLRAILGTSYAAMITEKPTVTLKAEVFEDQAKQDRLMTLLGEEFLDFFEVKTSLGVCEEFNKQVYRVLTPEQLDNLRVFAKQYKPSIR